MKKSILLLLLSFVFSLTAKSVTPDLRAPHAILMDFDSGKILYEKNADVMVPPSSMSKLLTVYKVF